MTPGKVDQKNEGEPEEGSGFAEQQTWPKQQEQPKEAEPKKEETNNDAPQHWCFPRVRWLPYVQNVLDETAVAPVGQRAKGLLYVGTAHVPGIRAVEWLVQEVQPQIQMMGSGAQQGQPGHIYVAGDNWDDTPQWSDAIHNAREQGRPPAPAGRHCWPRARGAGPTASLCCANTRPRWTCRTVRV